MIRVALDSQPLLGEKTGIGQYVDNLTNVLKRNREEIEIKYWFNQILKKKHSTLNIDQFDIINSSYPYKVIRRLQGPDLLHSYPIDIGDKFDLFHGTNFIGYNTNKSKMVLTIHDLAFLRYPEVADYITYRHHTRWLPYSIKKADHIIAVSNQTKKDIIDYYKVPEYKISVVHLAANHTVASVETHSFNLPEQYILFVGTLEPRKNIPFIIRGFALAKRKYSFNHKLVLVGKKGWKYEEIFKTIDDLKLNDEIIFLGFVTDQELSVIYKKASLFLFPSLYEGFGMPILEAMRHGVPVITSNLSSMPEIVGDSAIKISPNHLDELVESIGVLIENVEIHTNYSKKGLKQSKLFSWERVGKETLDVYKKVLS
ncbi:hypothetical protein DRW41_06855 [Neobacillus piezotolerans]|uniref:Glycosyltransferase family 1 protein n=1 Tax=Neobacillus piezotolerans TaxID=2259171 RepID=A0A3D8GSX2_9BACI|nr:glycosyltransferase family 1 protein [Neobacillus piezotolerans]RDU37555.1 hypothetical protein DRW41_06855 [Neobacillus piezotolerans]